METENSPRAVFLCFMGVSMLGCGRPGTGAAGKIGGRGGAAEQTAPRSQLDIYYISIRMGNLDLLRGFMIEHLFVFERMFW